MSSSKGSSPSPLSSAVIEGNDDLLVEILLFLPAKSLLTFKTVSKRWRSLISDPLFCRRHTLHHPLRRRETQTLFLFRTNRSEYKYVVRNPRNPKLYPSELQLGFTWVHVKQSCNGLLLLLRSGEGEGEGYRYCVFNLTTMQNRELPLLPTKSYARLYLMFDPFLSPHYKVVCFAYTRTKQGSPDVYLYKSEAREWKLVGEAIKMGVSCISGFYFNGGICFPGFGSSCLFTPDCNLTEIPDLPEHEYSLGKQQRRFVVESNGVLFSLRLSWNKEEVEGSNLLVVWEMKEKEDGWRKKYELDMNPIIAKCGRKDCGDISFVGMVRAEKEEDSLLMFSFHGGQKKIYRFSRGVLEDLDWCGGLGNTHHFIETLAPV